MFRNVTAVILSFALFFASASTVLPLGENASAATDYSNVRIKLSNANDGTINMAVDGYYTIDKNGAVVDSDIILKMVAANSISVVRKSTNAELYRGSSFDIVRNENQNGKSGLIRMFTTMAGNNQYLGSFRVSAENNQFSIINILPLEHYLYGVVAHEMNNSWPIEALKAQAVAARGYAAGKIGTRSGGYDLVDTPSDQVYKGFNKLHSNVMAAVDATRGQVIRHGGKIVLPFYGSSNGGQTELTDNVWSQKTPYCIMKDDPYDLKNPNSPSQRIFLPEDAVANNMSDALTNFFKVKVAPQLQKQGLSTYSDQIEILGITNVSADKPKYPSPSRSYTVVNADIKVKAIKGNGSGIVEPSQSGPKPTEPVFQQTDIMSATGPLFIDQNGILVDSATVQAAMEAYYAALAAWESADLQSSGKGMTGQSSTVSVPISFDFYELKDTGKSYKIFTNSTLRMYWVEPAQGGANLVNVRFGHGVGMSQRGAQQMANEGKSYKDVLNFYYDNISIDTLSYNTPVVDGVPTGTTTTATPTPTPSDNGGLIEEPTPTPTSTPDAALSTAVTGKALDNITLYNGPGEKNKKVGTLKKGGRLEVVAIKGDWALVVSKSGSLGCVSLATFEIDRGPAKVNELTVLSKEKGGGASVVKLGEKLVVNIIARDGDYYKVRVKTYEGYVPVTALSIYIKKPTVPLKAEKQFGQAQKSITVYSSSKKTKKLFTIPANHVMELLSKTKDGKIYNIVYNDKQGYIDSSNVKVLKKGSNHPNVQQVIDKYLPKSKTDKSAALTLYVGVGTLRPISAGSAVLVSGQLELSAAKALANGLPGKITGVTVNMRKSADSKSKIIVQLPKGEIVTVLGKSGAFYKVSDSKGNVGFIAKDFVEVQSSKIGTITGITVNVRSAPNTTSSIVVQLAKGENVTVLASSGAFYKVETKEGKVGYISDEFIKLGAAVIPDVDGGTGGDQNSGSNQQNAAPATLPQKPAASGVITGGNVNMRETASGNAKVIDTVPVGTRVNIFSKNGDYYRVAYGGNVGYVLRSYIPASTLAGPITTKSNSSQVIPSSTASNAQVKLGKVSPDTLNVRTESGKVILTLKGGDIVEIVSTSGSKYKIKSGNVMGFVESSYIKSLTSLKTASVISSGLNVRESASTQAKRLAVAYPKETVYIIADQGEWLKVYYNGVTGFVLAKHVQVS